MKKIDLGQTVQIAANVGVIAGIIFLGVELQQNNELLKAQALAYQSDRAAGFAEEILRNSDLATALVKIENDEELTLTEEMLVRAMALRTFRSWEWQFNEYQERRLASLDYLPMWRAAMRGDGIVNYRQGAYWTRMKHRFPADFAQFIDENVVNR